MTRHYSKRKELENKITSLFFPKIRKKLAKNAKFANVCYALPSGARVFQVFVKNYQHIVDLTAKTCDCRRWQLTSIPCCHAISFLRHERIIPESVLPNCYSLDAYNSAYAYSIWACKDKSEWEKMDEPHVLPPVYEKRIGRCHTMKFPISGCE
jgi:DNA-binding transcriptional regulator PaaX